MNIKQELKKLGLVDVSSLKELIPTITEAEWEASSWRQKKYGVHKSTRTISLIFDEQFHDNEPTILDEYYKYESFVKPAMDAVAKHYNQKLKAKRLRAKHGKGYVIRLNLVNLLPGGIIYPHMDHAFTLMHSHRVHLPITTNEGVIFSVGDEKVHMQEGELWEINNRKMHSVVNEGSSNRVHMIIDWRIPGERCCCGSKLRPTGICNPGDCRVTDNAETPCDCYS